MVILKDINGDTSSLDNVRPITISDMIVVIFENYYLARFQNIPLDDNQFGFRKSSSCTHPIFALKTVKKDLMDSK